MSIRDELAKDIFISDNCRALDPEREWEKFIEGYEGDTYAHVIADGLLERGWVRGKEEWGVEHRSLDGLTVSVVKDDHEARMIYGGSTDERDGVGGIVMRRVTDWKRA